MSNQNFGKKKYLTQRVYETLKKRIIKCEIEPGEPLYEQNIVAELGVSRTPVREAFQRLENDNLIIIYPKRGFFVTSISVNDIQDILGMREILEPHAARLATPIIDIDSLKRFKTYWQECDVHTAAEHIEMDRKFHLAIAESCGNKYLSQVMARMYDQMIRMRYLSLRRVIGRQKEAKDEHLVIIECMIARDAAGAEQAMSYHIAQARQTSLSTSMK